jgi:phosphomannomutase
MTLIKSISGIRGTIGGKPGEGLTPMDLVRFSSAYAEWLKKRSGKPHPVIIIGRDARISGPMVTQIVCGTLMGMGVNVIDLGLSTTPTVEVAVPMEKADGGIILTASHNPIQWNALKLLNEKGEFISAEDGVTLISIAEKDAFNYAEVLNLGWYRKDDSYMQKHIDAILNLKLVDKKKIQEAGFRIVVDGINSSGAVFVPALLKALGVNDITLLNENPDGNFAHNPEPLKEHLTETCNIIRDKKAHLGIVVDPDVDRLAFISEDGEMFGEEYTLVAIADYILQHHKGNTVSNLSSSRALADVAQKNGGNYYASAVGEVNVVVKMKETKAVIGGEGNGGVIYPELHYGRDSLVGIALFLTHLANKKCSMSQLRKQYPAYFMSKNKIELKAGMNVDRILTNMEKIYSTEKINTEDGVKIDFANEWVHLRKSNTEPIIRIYTEAKSQQEADSLAQRFVEELKRQAGL